MTKNTLINNCNCINSIAESLITDFNLNPEIKEDLISEGKVALIECKNNDNFRNCVKIKMMQFIKKEKEYIEKKIILENDNYKKTDIELFLIGFGYLPKKIQGEISEILLKQTEVDSETFEETFREMIDLISEKKPEIAKRLEKNYEQIQKIVPTEKKIKKSR